MHRSRRRARTILRLPPMPGRERSIVDLGDEPMLHRIAVDVTDVRREIVGVGDNVFPEAALPDAPLAGAAARGKVRRAGQAAGETALDPAPTSRKIAVALG